MSVDLDAGDLVLLRESFQLESNEIITALEEALLALEDRPEDLELVSVLFRGAHTIKGNARVVGVDHVGEFTHAFEDLLEAVRGQRLAVDHSLISFLLRVVDALRKMIADAAQGSNSLTPEQQTLKTEIAALTPARDGRAARAHQAETPSESELAVEAFAPAAGRAAKTLRVAISKLDRIMDLVGEISIARGRVSEMISGSHQYSRREVLEVHHESDLLYMDLQELVMQMRMVPVGPLFREYVRAVRDFSLESGKGVRLYLEGEDVEVDTTVVEHLRDPLTHLVRNALNHGIETTEERIETGKPPVGRVTLRAFHDAGSIVVEVEDDGAGLNREKVRRRAVERGLANEADALSEAQLFNFIFEPGFSTADEVTEISGRGVGMDVVRKNIELLRGTVAVESREGEGTKIVIRLPLTLAIIDGFRVGVRSETYIIPLDNVVECVELPGDDRDHDRGFGVTQLRGKALPFVHLSNFFNLSGEASPRENVIVVRNEGQEAGFAVDQLFGEGQAVIKPLNAMFKGIPGLTGTSILGNGRVAFVLDVPGLMRLALEQGAGADGTV